MKDEAMTDPLAYAIWEGHHLTGPLSALKRIYESELFPGASKKKPVLPFVPFVWKKPNELFTPAILTFDDGNGVRMAYYGPDNPPPSPEGHISIFMTLEKLFEDDGYASIYNDRDDDDFGPLIRLFRDDS